jgi:two-component system, NarL family, response regulator NreC
MTPYRIILADDHVLLRHGLRRLLDATDGLLVVGEASDGLELLDALKRVPADLVVLDISMPRLRGIEALHDIRALHPHLRTLVVTMHGDTEYVFQAMSAGAHGYLVKEDADSELFAAIAKIRQGGLYVSPRLSDALTRDWADARRRGRAPQAPLEPLTVREREILKLTAEGKTSREIGAALRISPRTVQHHRANITDKLEAKGTANLVRYAIARGYLEVTRVS